MDKNHSNMSAQAHTFVLAGIYLGAGPVCGGQETGADGFS